MAEIRISIEKQNFDAAGQKIRNAASKAMLRAANAAIRNVKVETLKFITDRIDVKQKDIKTRIFTRSARFSRPEAAMFVYGSRIPLFKFGARKKTVQTSRGKRQGVTALIKGVRALVPGGFIATMPNGKTGVFARSGAARLPINQLFSNEVNDLLAGETGFLTRLESQARQVMKVNFDREFKFYLSK